MYLNKFHYFVPILCILSTALDGFGFSISKLFKKYHTTSVDNNLLAEKDNKKVFYNP